MLKIYGIPVRVFTDLISGFSASTFGETPNFRLWLPGAVSQCASPTGNSTEKQIECFGLQATSTDVLMRVQMLDGSYLTTLIQPSRPRSSAWHARDHVGVAENASVIGLTTLILQRVSS